MIRFALGFAVVLSTTLLSTSASAFFHLWRFTEFFSNHDGSVQFIELASLGPGEQFAQGATITSSSTGKVFTFPNNLSGSTANKRLLIATAGFGTLSGGVTTDFTLPSTSFFNPAGDTITLFAGFPVDTKTFSTVPSDGVTSRHYVASTGATSLGTNNPANYAGATGSVNLAPPAGPTGDYNGNGTVDAADYVLWRNTLDQTVSMGTGADGNGNGTVDDADYNFWRTRFGTTVPAAGGVSPVPEPTTATLVVAAMGAFVHLGKTRRNG
jgi:hypothetical protein